jgi:hypothetical protein
LALGAEYGHTCSWGFFLNYWTCNYPKLMVCKPSKDICGLCYPFHLVDRTVASSSRKAIEIIMTVAYNQTTTTKTMMTLMEH